MSTGQDIFSSLLSVHMGWCLLNLTQPLCRGIQSAFRRVTHQRPRLRRRRRVYFGPFSNNLGREQWGGPNRYSILPGGQVTYRSTAAVSMQQVRAMSGSWTKYVVVEVCDGACRLWTRSWRTTSMTWRRTLRSATSSTPRWWKVCRRKTTKTPPSKCSSHTSATCQQAEVCPAAQPYLLTTSTSGWLGSRVVSVLDSCAEGPGSFRRHDAVG